MTLKPRYGLAMALVISWVALAWGGADPANPPATLRLTVSKSGQTRTFWLERYSVRGENFELVLMGTDGVTKTTIDPGPVRTYRGWCEEESDSFVEATLLPNGDLRYQVFKGAAADWWFAPPGETNPSAPATNNYTLIGGTPIQPAGVPLEGASFIAPAATLDTFYLDTYQADVGFDLLTEYVSKFNYSDWSIYGRKAETDINRFNAVTLRDILGEYKLGKVVIRQSQAGLDYTNAQWGINWPQVNTWWNQLFPGVNHHHISMVGSVGGGVAFVCDYGGNQWAARSLNGWSSDGSWWHVWRHECGHNLGSGDCVEGCPGPDGSTINSNNNLELSRFSNPEITQIINCRRRSDRYTVLRKLGTYSFPVPPYANLDRVTASVMEEAIILDVLGNDYDANCDQLALAGFDATSTLGATVLFGAGMGPNGRDALIYIPAGNSLGQDKFTYSIVDATGRTGAGNVIVNLDLPNTLKGYWRIDETSGTTVADAGVFQRNGALENTDLATATTAGVYGSAVTLDGVDDRIKISDLNLNSNTVTITAWIKRDTTVNPWSAIVFNRPGGACGLNFGSGSELRYHWNDSNWNWNPNLTVPANTWTFVALVVEPARATIYMDSGTGLVSKTNTATHAPGAFTGSSYIGWDSNSSSRSFKGAIDEVRVYNMALNRAALEAIRDGGQAESPSPFHLARGVVSPVLNWVGSANASNRQIYLGTDAAAVEAATTDSPEYRGQTTTLRYIARDLKPNTVYFWRIDEQVAGATRKGRLWQFTTGPEVGSGALAHWKFDEGNGALAGDSSGNNNHGAISGATWTTGRTGKALLFNGAGRITCGTGPALSGKTDFTLTGWVKTTYATSGTIIQQRNGGFNGEYQLGMSSTGTLKFMLYGDSAYQFDFSTTAKINNGQWRFFAARRMGNDATLFIDGSPSAQASGTARNLSGSIGVGIGADIRDSRDYFRGTLDDLRIYDFALSNAEIGALFDSYNDDLTAPTPNPPTWSVRPAPLGPTSVGMTATAAADPSGVEYFFGCLTPGCHDSGWQTLSNYVDTGLTDGVEYRYIVRLRDRSPAANTTGDSFPGIVSIQLLNGRQGLTDWRQFSQLWLAQDCGFCSGADLTGSGQVNLDDLLLFSANWLATR